MFKAHRISLRLSQSELSRRSGVSRIRIHLSEHGDLILTEREQIKIRAALQAEIDRVRNLPASVDPVGAADVDGQIRRPA